VREEIELRDLRGFHWADFDILFVTRITLLDSFLLFVMVDGGGGGGLGM